MKLQISLSKLREVVTTISIKEVPPVNSLVKIQIRQHLVPLTIQTVSTKWSMNLRPLSALLLFVLRRM